MKTNLLSLFGRARRRSLLSRLLTKRVSAPSVVGACGVCGIKFAASRGRQADTARVLCVHETICPGGERSGEVATPYE